MNQTKSNQVVRGNISGSHPFIELILALQEDNVFLNSLFQDADLSEFPEVPEFGGVLSTRKGAYEGIWTDDAEPLPRWRRIADSTLYEAGDTIPTTL